MAGIVLTWLAGLVGLDWLAGLAELEDELAEQTEIARLSSLSQLTVW